ncbi:hypothetical protein ACFPMG_04570 [Azospirillum himalayense]|uniref:Uncharacterized protein n=1 Tax=Azospirillum himalayense TaxID=654847 RepID=A0ABW0G097_9PROT
MNNKQVVRFLFPSRLFGSTLGPTLMALIRAALHAAAGTPAPPEPYGLVVSG